MSALSPEMAAELAYRRARLMAEADAERLANLVRGPGPVERLVGWLRGHGVLAQSGRRDLRTS